MLKTTNPHPQSVENRFNANVSFRMIRKTITCLLLCFLVLSLAGREGSVRADESKDRNILEFLGVLTEQQARDIVVAEGDYLIALKRRTDTTADRTPAYYYVLLKRLPAVEIDLLQDAADGHWDEFNLFQAALIVEGINDLSKVRQYEKRLDGIAHSLQEKAKQNAKLQNSEELTRFLFENLHREVLTGDYGIDNTNPARALDSGNFNCVSATVLFNTLAQRSGLDVCGLEMSGHVLSRAKYGSKIVDLETTCPNWYSLKNNSEKQREVRSKIAGGSDPNSAPRALREGSRTTVAKPLVQDRLSSRKQGESPVQPSVNANTDPGDSLARLSKELREISDVQLVATVYYNQGYDYWQNEQFSEAVVANAKALHLDPQNATAWGNLIGAINNLALGFADSQHRQYDLAAGLLDQIVLLDPGFESLQANQLCVYYMWIKALGQEGRIDDANAVYAEAEQRLAGNVELKNLIQSIRKTANR